MIDQKCRVWLETPDGKVIEATAVYASISVNMESYGISRTRMELEVLGTPLWVDRPSFQHKLRHAAEWQCGYCGRPNARQREMCAGCGAVRPFIYD